MKLSLRPALVIATLAAAGLAIAGPLTPPAGPVAPTYKTLSDIQPRTPISALPFTISQSGSYYLTGNLTATGPGTGITVNANDVTIDLNGFSLIGVAGAGMAIDGGHTGLTVKNGFVRSWPGIGIDNHSAGDSVIDRVTVTACGGIGILAGPKSVVSNCHATNNAGGGITAYFSSRVVDCMATSNGFSPGTAGIRAEQRSTVTNCSAVYSTGAGISAGEFVAISGCNSHKNTTSGFVCSDKATIENSFSTENTADGINATNHATVRGNICNENGDDGIQVASDCTVTENSCHYNGPAASGAGVYAVGYESRILDNDFSYNRYGVYINGVTLNLVAHNCSRQCGGGNYTITPAASNNVAPSLNYNPSPAQWTHQYTWANLSY